LGEDVPNWFANPNKITSELSHLQKSNQIKDPLPTPAILLITSAVMILMAFYRVMIHLKAATWETGAKHRQPSLWEPTVPDEPPDRGSNIHAAPTEAVPLSYKKRLLAAFSLSPIAPLAPKNPLWI
jgi:hypothetical protein